MREWLVGIFGEAYATAAFWIIVLVAVAILLWIVLRLTRRLTPGTFISGARGRQPRLAVTDATPVDNHRRLVLIRRDDVEHLLLIGGPSDVVVESNIPLPGAADRIEPRTAPARSEPAARPVPQAPASRSEPPQYRQPAPPVRRQEPVEPAIQVAEAERPVRAPSPAPVPPPAAVVREAPRAPAFPQSPAAPSAPVAPAIAAAGAVAAPAVSAAGQDEPVMAVGLEEEETYDELSEALEYDEGAARGEADHSLEDEMSKLLEELADERK